MAWKKRKIQEKKDTAKKEEDKKRNDYKAGRQVGLSGREMFSFNPEMATQNDMEEGDEAFDSYNYSDNEDDETAYKEINLDLIEAKEVDGSGTVASEERLKTPIENNSNSTSDDIDGAAAVPINENLFLEEDLDALDEELNDLDLEE